MKNDETKQGALLLLQRTMVLFLLPALLAACALQRPDMAPAETAAVAVAGAVETPATTGSASPVVTAGATATMETTATSSPAEESNATATPVPPTPWQETRLPVLGSAETPPATGCVVYQTGRTTDAQLPLVYSGRDTGSGVLGQLGRNHWANGLQRQDGWFEIIIGPGQTGWVRENGIGVHGECDTDVRQTVPVIMNRGAPSNYRCVAMRPGNSAEAPPIYENAALQSTLMGRLGNWADVRKEGQDWYQLALPTGGSGWVAAGQVELNTGCGTSGPIRIEFPAGATGTTVEGTVPAQAQVTYLFWAAAGQELEISVSSPENSILFHVEGIEDGQVLKDLLDGESTWQGTVPTSQDYRLTLDNAGEMATYTMQLAILLD